MARKIVLILCLCLLVGCGGNSSTSTPPPPPTITGAWAGSVVASGGGTSALNGNLVQGQTQPDGSILFSGTLFLSNSCISSLTISGKIAGGAFALTGTFSDGSVLNVTATLNAADTQITGNYNQQGGTVCASGTGTFALTKQ
jgi:hypothetical protein